MSKKRKERVVFYSENDITSSHSLNLAEEILNQNTNYEDLGINDFLEFYHINLFFENQIFLKKWSPEEQSKYLELSKELFKKSMIFFNGITEEKILDYLKELEYFYEESFWYILNKFKIYSKISSSYLINILNNKPHSINFILKNKDISNHYKLELREFLLNYDNTGDILLYYAKINGKDFPDKILTNEDKADIIDKYVDAESNKFGNLDFIQKLGDGFLKIPAKTKLKAKRKYEQENEDFFKNNDNVIKYGYQIELSEEQKESVKISKTEDGYPKITYSVAFFDKFDFYTTPFDIFFQTFGYINHRHLIELVSKEYKISAIEGVFSHWEENYYKDSMNFKDKEMHAILNLTILQNYFIKYKNISFENLLNGYIKNILTKIKGLENILFELDVSNIDEDKKLKINLANLDNFIKQYKCFVEEGNIDFDLIGIDSKPVSYENIPSILVDKYFYEKENKLGILKYNFYSDQSGLFYIKGYEYRYKNFYNLIKKENLKLENFENYQKETINYFIQEGYLCFDKDKFIRIKDEIFIFIVGEIYREEVLNYYTYSDNIRNKIDEMKNNNLIYSESTLLSKIESDYINYYFNKKKFLNGIDIRNKNMHGYLYLSKEELKSDYIVVIRIIILILIKIDLELKVNLI